MPAESGCYSNRGVGYEVNVPLTTSEKLPPLGRVSGYIYRQAYREDSQTLYGFIDRESRDFFKMIVDKVSGNWTENCP